MLLESLARLDSRMRPLVVGVLPPRIAIKLYAEGRTWFVNQLTAQRPSSVPVPLELGKTLWGISFRSPLGNAAGLFKSGKGYEFVQLQGAGWFLAGTSTATPRSGNVKLGIRHPFTPYPRSHAASNFMGMPNPGDEAIARELEKIAKVPGCPIGISVAADPSVPEGERMGRFLGGLRRFDQSPVVDFIELNESCPNTGELNQSQGLMSRLEFMSKQFLVARSRRLPVVVKFSCDTPLNAVPQLVEEIVRLGFDGINFGNTSTQYGKLLNAISEAERRQFSFFTEHFGGGISGAPLREASLALIRAAAQAVKVIKPQHEFHLIRTGGVESIEDVRLSLEAGASLAQWYTGYFEHFSLVGHRVYRDFYRALLDGWRLP